MQRWPQGLAAWALAQLLEKGLCLPPFISWLLPVSLPPPPVWGSSDCGKGKQSRCFPCVTQEASASLSRFFPGPFLLGYEALPLMDAKKRGGGMQNKEMGRHNARRNNPDDPAFGLGC